MGVLHALRPSGSARRLKTFVETFGRPGPRKRAKATFATYCATIFVVGALAFATATVMCSVAPGPTWLVVARVAQGCGAALLVPNSLAMATHPRRAG